MITSLIFDAIQKKNESFPGIDELSNFTTTTYSEGYKDTYRTEGHFTRARYDYNETYFAEASSGATVPPSSIQTIAGVTFGA